MAIMEVIVRKIEVFKFMKIYAESDTLKRLPDQFFANLVKKVSNVADQGHDVINLGRGNPDLPTPDYIVKALQKGAEDPINHQYAPFRGFPYLREAVATFYKREYDVDIDPEKEVAVLYGSRAGLIELSQCLLNPGDVALLPNPGYPDYISGIAIANAKMELFTLSEENNFLPDYSQIPDKTLDEAKLMFLNYPGNPTATLATEEIFDETVAIADKHNICVVHDFAYGAFGFDGKKPRSFLQTEGAKEVGIETYTLSKTYNMAGWRVAFAVGNASVVRRHQGQGDARPHPRPRRGGAPAQGRCRQRRRDHRADAALLRRAGRTEQDRPPAHRRLRAERGDRRRAPRPRGQRPAGRGAARLHRRGGHGGGSRRRPAGQRDERPDGRRHRRRHDRRRRHQPRRHRHLPLGAGRRRRGRRGDHRVREVGVLPAPR